MTITEQIHQVVLKFPRPAWTAAIERRAEIRDGAWVAELSGDCLKRWPKGMPLIVRKERPHPEPSSSGHGPRTASGPRTTGLRNLPPHDTTQNQIWLEIVQLALDLLTWMPTFALTGETRRREPRRLRLRRPDRHHIPPPAPEVRTSLALDRRDHRRPGTARSSPVPRLISTFPSCEQHHPDRNRGTRRPLDATAGTSACPPPTRTTETARRRNRRTVTKDRG